MFLRIISAFFEFLNAKGNLSQGEVLLPGTHGPDIGLRINVFRLSLFVLDVFRALSERRATDPLRQPAGIFINVARLDVGEAYFCIRRIELALFLRLQDLVPDACSLRHALTSPFVGLKMGLRNPVVALKPLVMPPVTTKSVSHDSIFEPLTVRLLIVLLKARLAVVEPVPVPRVAVPMILSRRPLTETAQAEVTAAHRFLVLAPHRHITVAIAVGTVAFLVAGF